MTEKGRGEKSSYRGLQANETARTLTARYGQNWIQGKSLDSSCPLGPAIALSDELQDPYPLRIVWRVSRLPVFRPSQDFQPLSNGPSG